MYTDRGSQQLEEYPLVLPLGYAVSLHVATITQFCACKHWGAG